MRLLTTLAEAVRPARDVLFPPVCPICRAETGAAHTLCSECWPDLTFLGDAGCRSCGHPMPGAVPGDDFSCDECLRFPRAWDRGRAVFRYDGAGRRLVLGLKHGDRQDIVPMLVAWMLRAARDLVEDADLVAPVPLHWTRRMKRRVNQSVVLARTLCRHAGKPGAFAPRLLVRTRRTASQDGKNRDARLRNLSGALAPGPGPMMQGRRVLLVDDVLTTGATLDEAARVCLAAGARAVDISVLALVVRDETHYIRAPDQDEDTPDHAKS